MYFYHEKKLHKQILAKLSKIVDKKTLQQLEIITIAIMSMTGRVTMLGISRWSDKYSYKKNRLARDKMGINKKKN